MRFPLKKKKKGCPFEEEEIYFPDEDITYLILQRRGVMNVNIELDVSQHYSNTYIRMCIIWRKKFQCQPSVSIKCKNIIKYNCNHVVKEK